MTACQEEVTAAGSQRALDHAWAWFTVQTAHRFHLIEYWFGGTAVLTTALVIAVTRPAWGVAALVGFAGAGAAAAFQLFDRRARELIGASEAALRPLQRGLAFDSGIPEMEILRAVHGPGRSCSYRVVIGWLHGATAGLFAFAALYSLYRMAV